MSITLGKSCIVDVGRVYFVIVFFFIAIKLIVFVVCSGNSLMICIIILHQFKSPLNMRLTVIECSSGKWHFQVQDIFISNCSFNPINYWHSENFLKTPIFFVFVRFQFSKLHFLLPFAMNFIMFPSTFKKI